LQNVRPDPAYSITLNCFCWMDIILIRLFLFISIFLNLTLVSFFFSEEKKEVKFLASKDEVECIENWKKEQLDIEPIWGPEQYSNYFIASYNSSIKNISFHNELSSCFYDSVIKLERGEKELPSAIRLMKEQGFSKVAYFKQYGTSTITLYGKESN